MVEIHNDQKSVPTWLEWLQCVYDVEIANEACKWLDNFEVHFRGPVGSIEGPRLVLDPMEVRSCVPRVPWNVLYCLECKNMTDTAGFQVEDDCVPPPSPPVIIVLKIARDY